MKRRITCRVPDAHTGHAVLINLLPVGQPDHRRPREILAGALRQLRQHAALRVYIFTADWSLLDSLRQVYLSRAARLRVSIHHGSALALCPRLYGEAA